MDQRLVAWGRAVKARMRRLGGKSARRPVLWLFTDAVRLADPRRAVAKLPKGMCGVVLRHDGAVDRAVLARDLARLCRQRGNVLVVAGDARLAAAVGAGLHLRGGRRTAGMARGRGWRTSSAHDGRELRRAARAGAAIAFLSPAFATASHPGAAGLGACRWSRLALRMGGMAAPGISIGALGGIDGRSVRRLPRAAVAAGAIGALA